MAGQYALGVFITTIFLIGVVWGVLYFGAIQPMLSSATAQYPGVFSNTDLAMVKFFTGGYIAFTTFLLVFWLWNQSKATSGYSYG
ncbi:MAG: hypothetical protein JRN50_02355 [Nitrososphaerota archaeon]|nr:hypothetical protein [Nitrososphaerota archaeon]